MEIVYNSDKARIVKAIEAEIETNDKYQLDIANKRDLVLNSDKTGSTHMLKEVTRYGSRLVPIVLDSVEDHKKFHHFNPLKQGLIQTDHNTYRIQEKKQIVDVDMSQRPRIIQGLYGPIPHLFSMPNTPQDLSNPVYKKRW